MEDLHVAPTGLLTTSALAENSHRLATGSVASVSLLERITSDPEICHGKPTVRGMRFPVETLLELLASGMLNEEILADNPDLERDDIFAALEFAALVLRMPLSEVSSPSRT